MKNSIKILFVAALMLFAMSFSAFGATKTSEKILTNAQIATLQSAQFKQAQITYNLLRAKCLKLSNNL